MTGSPIDPLTLALSTAEEYAARSERPFTEAELWSVLRSRGLGFAGDPPIPSDSPEGLVRGVFVAKVALDYLYAQRVLKRNMNNRGDYVYSR
ncbi:MAG TPA: hypothetical protein VMH90_04180 [Thermoplasmata archaeon]|nr:hypothetical protein [Thermoplasmata archaeon]